MGLVCCMVSKLMVWHSYSTSTIHRNGYLLTYRIMISLVDLRPDQIDFFVACLHKYAINLIQVGGQLVSHKAMECCCCDN